MSSYLTIYGVPKNEGKPIDIVSFSRSHCIYSAICDEVNVAWAGESEVYTNLNTSDLDGVIHSIEEIILLKEYLEELTTSKNYCEFLRYIISWTSLGFSDFSQICCNVG